MQSEYCKEKRGENRYLMRGEKRLKILCQTKTLIFLVSHLHLSRSHQQQSLVVPGTALALVLAHLDRSPCKTCPAGASQSLLYRELIWVQLRNQSKKKHGRQKAMGNLYVSPYQNEYVYIGGGFKLLSSSTTDTD